MKARDYAKAIANINENEVTSSEILSLLERKGHRHLLPRIIRELEKIRTRTNRNETLFITAATALQDDEVKAVVERERASLGVTPKTRVSVRVDSTLIGGEVLQKGGKEVDGSFKGMLIEIHRRMLRSL